MLWLAFNGSDHRRSGKIATYRGGQREESLRSSHKDRVSSLVEVRMTKHKRTITNCLCPEGEKGLFPVQVNLVNKRQSAVTYGLA